LRKAKVGTILSIESGIMDLVEMVRSDNSGGRNFQAKISYPSFCRLTCGFYTPKPQQGEAASSSSDDRLDFEPEDTFGRMLVHGIAQFHGLDSSSCSSSRGIVTVRRAVRSGGKMENTPYEDKSTLLPTQRPGIHLSCADMVIAMKELGPDLTHLALESFIVSRGLKSAWAGDICREELNP
jgi:hypothetical protein